MRERKQSESQCLSETYRRNRYELQIFPLKIFSGMWQHGTSCSGGVCESLCFSWRKFSAVFGVEGVTQVWLPFPLTTPSVCVQLWTWQKFTCECLVTPAQELEMRGRDSVSLTLCNLLQCQVKWEEPQYYNSGYNQLYWGHWPRLSVAIALTCSAWIKNQVCGENQWPSRRSAHTSCTTSSCVRLVIVS